MKNKIALAALAMIMSLFAFSQNKIEITFTAENCGAYVSMDSIHIENLTQGGDTMLYPPDSVLILDILTGIQNRGINPQKDLSLSQNHPNPFVGNTEINLSLNVDEDLKITVLDILGRELLEYNGEFKKGNHSFSFHPGNEKVYMLHVSGKQTQSMIKMLNATANLPTTTKSRLVYNGCTKSEIGFKSQDAGKGIIFTIGDELKYTAYAACGSNSVIDSPDASQIFSFEYAGYPCVGTPFVTDIDGNIYNTVQIGLQCWMKENLKTTTYRNQTPIPNISDDLSWSEISSGAYVWYDNSSFWKDTYGALYNWHAVVDPNGICPSGWHPADNDEWTQLTDFIGGILSPNANKLKSCRQENSPLGGDCETSNHPRWNQNSSNFGTDDFGFSGLPGGRRNEDGSFIGTGESANWWTSTINTSFSAKLRFIFYNYGNISVGNGNKRYGFSVRCIKD